MPLFKGMNVDAELSADTYRRREFIIQQDYVRRVSMNKDVSIRTSHLSGMAFIETLRSISEPDVKIDLEVQQAYADAEDWLCRKMTDLFTNMRSMGMNPARMEHEIGVFREKAVSDPFKGSELIFIPACAFYVGDERIYMFRTVEKSKVDFIPEINHMTSGAFGCTKDYMVNVAPELAAYVSRLENKAMDDKMVRDSFTRLGALLRPEAYKAEMIEERAKEYSGKADFGGWA